MNYIPILLRKSFFEVLKMRLLIKFALKNLIGAGIRTWLNSLILAIVLIVIILLQGIYDGFQNQVEKIRIAEETGLSQLWNRNLDPLNPLTFKKNIGSIPRDLSVDLEGGTIAAILFSSAVIFPHNRLSPVILKGINPNQKVLSFPTEYLATEDYPFPVMIGSSMAEQLDLKVGDSLVIRLRTLKGVVDAADSQIVHIFSTNAPAIDSGQIWLPLKKLQELLGAKRQVSILVNANPSIETVEEGWFLKEENDLLSDTKKLIASKKGGAVIIYGILLLLALISLLDTQILSIFRRKKEVGLLMALGFTQKQVAFLFTTEGIIQGLFSSFIAFIIGGPLLYKLQIGGIQLLDFRQFGIAGSQKLYPYFSLDLVWSTFFLIMGFIFIISYWPVKRIQSLSPSEALRGNWQ